MIRAVMIALFVRMLLMDNYALGDGGASPTGPTSPCPESTTTDTDGMPLCPDVVSTDSAWRVWQCAYNQVKAWHQPSKQEKDSSSALIKLWAKERSSGQTPEIGAGMVAAAKGMGAQICRARPAGDSYLVVYAGKGVKDYSGGNLLLRETANTSKLVLVFPHSDSDGYYAASPIALAHSHALALVGNGHKRGNVAQGKDSDFVHHIPNLAYDSLQDILQAYPGRILMHFHGDQASTTALYRPQDGSKLGKAFELAVTDATRVTSFKPLNAGFTTDNLPFAAQIKTELPAVIYMKQHESAARIFTNLEKNGFIWDSTTHEADLAGTETEMVGDYDEFEVDTSWMFATPAPGPWVPPSRPNLGSKELICAAIQYSSGPSANEAKCHDLAVQASDYYKRQSQGKLTLVAKAVSLPIDGPAGGVSAAKAEDILRKTYPNALFLLPNLWYQGTSHAGQRVAFLTGYSNSLHELGHLLGLGHCGAYKPDGSFDQYAGGGCIMSRFFGNAYLAPSQYIYLAWYEKNQYAVMTTPTAQEFEIRSISALSAPGLAAIAIAPALLGGGRAGYIAYPPNCQNGPCLAFYYAEGGGSQRVKMFGNEYIDASTGLHIKSLGMNGGKIKLSVGFDHPPQ